MTYSPPSALADRRVVFCATLLSLAIHCLALLLFPAMQGGSTRMTVRLQPRAGEAQPAAAGERLRSAGLARNVLQTQGTSGLAPKADGAGVVAAPNSNGVAQRRAKRLAADVARPRQAEPLPKPAAPASLPAIESRAGEFDAASLRGVRVSLARGLNGLVLPQHMPKGRTEARLSFGGGGHLLALVFSGDRSSAALEQALRAPLMQAAQAMVLPPSLQGARFEIDLQFEYGD